MEKAYRKARKAKRYRPEVLLFTANLDENLLTIQEELRNETVEIGPYRRHWVFVPKKRLVMALPFDSRIVQWAVYLLLNLFYDRLMIEDSYACRENKGSLAAIQRLQYWIRLIQNKPGKWYYLKLDISKYFYRIDHAVLLEILGKRIKDKKLLRLLEKIIQSTGERFGLPRFTDPDDLDPEEWLDIVGMPIGNLTSQLFANIYLTELDQYCKHTLKTHYYIRYMDDVIILASSKEQAQEYLEAVRAYLLDRLHLDLNGKTTIRPVGTPIEFVGYKATAKYLKLRKATVRRVKSAFRAICCKYFSGQMSREDFERRVASYKGLIAHCKNTGLRTRLNEIYIHAKEAAETSNLKMIETLCTLCEEQSSLLRTMAQRLGELGDTALTDEIEAADKKYREIIGSGEAPDPA